jgi:hypothetical protein
VIKAASRRRLGPGERSALEQAVAEVLAVMPGEAPAGAPHARPPDDRPPAGG